MSFSPGINVPVEPMLFGVPTCTVCGAELGQGGSGRGGRPRKYCSKACSSRADRQRDKERQVQTLAASAQSPRGETPLPAGLATSPEAVELLALSENLRRQDTAFLLRLDRAARQGDPALASQALADILHAARALTARHRELAEQLLATHPTRRPEPDQTLPIPGVSPRGETRPREVVVPNAAGGDREAPPAGLAGAADPEPLAPAPRGEAPVPEAPTATTSTTGPEHVEAPRGETPSAVTDAAPEPVAPRGETSSAAQPGRGGLRELVDRRLAQQASSLPAAAAPALPAVVAVPADPMLRRLPDTDVTTALDNRIFGDFWALAGWTVNPDVLLVGRGVRAVLPRRPGHPGGDAARHRRTGRPHHPARLPAQHLTACPTAPPNPSTAYESPG